MYEPVERITVLMVEQMTREEAQRKFNELGTLQSDIRCQMDLLRKKIWPRKEVEEIFCPRCQNKEVQPMPRGGYLCKVCHTRWGEYGLHL